MTDNEGNVILRLVYIYWKHPESTKCVLGFGFAVNDSYEEVKKWNRREEDKK